MSSPSLRHRSAFPTRFPSCPWHPHHSHDSPAAAETQRVLFWKWIPHHVSSVHSSSRSGWCPCPKAPRPGVIPVLSFLCHTRLLVESEIKIAAHELFLEISTGCCAQHVLGLFLLRRTFFPPFPVFFLLLSSVCYPHLGFCHRILPRTAITRFSLSSREPRGRVHNNLWCSPSALLPPTYPLNISPDFWGDGCCSRRKAQGEMCFFSKTYLHPSAASPQL